MPKLISSSDSGSDMGESIVLTLSPEGLFQMNGRVRFETAKNYTYEFSRS